MNTTPEQQQPEEISSTLENGVWNIRLNRPAKRNALTMPMFRALAESLGKAERQPDVRAVMLSGEGNNFSAGHDLQAFGEWPQSPQDPVPLFLHALASLNKPLVVAVHGGVAGIGVTMLMHADWVVCSPDAKLRLPFAELDIGPEAASSVLLAQAVGSLRAKRLLLGGEAFSGEQAYNWGLVTELADTDAVLGTALRRAEQLSHRSALAAALKRWQMPEAEIHARIDEEIQFINERVRQHARSTAQSVKVETA